MSTGRPARWSPSAWAAQPLVVAAACSRHSSQTRRPSPVASSYLLPDTIERPQSVGAATHSSGGKNTCSVTAMQPIGFVSWRLTPVLALSRSRRVSSSWASAVPFAWSNTSQACQTGSVWNRENSPNPPTALCGAFSLKKNGSPGFKARNELAPGRQKLTSAISGRARRNWYQPWSVGATEPCTSRHFAPCAPISTALPVLGCQAERSVCERPLRLEPFERRQRHESLRTRPRPAHVNQLHCAARRSAHSFTSDAVSTVYTDGTSRTAAGSAGSSGRSGAAGSDGASPGERRDVGGLPLGARRDPCKRRARQARRARGRAPSPAYRCRCSRRSGRRRGCSRGGTGARCAHLAAGTRHGADGRRRNPRDAKRHAVRVAAGRRGVVSRSPSGVRRGREAGRASPSNTFPTWCNAAHTPLTEPPRCPACRSRLSTGGLGTTYSCRASLPSASSCGPTRT